MAYLIPPVLFPTATTSTGDVVFDPPVEVQLYAEVIKDHPTQYIARIEGTDVVCMTTSKEEVVSDAYLSLVSGLEEALFFFTLPEEEREGVSPWKVARYKRLLENTAHRVE